MSQLLPYETIVKASEGDPEAVAAVLSHYAGYIRACSKMDGHINVEMQEHIIQKLIESLFKFRFIVRFCEYMSGVLNSYIQNKKGCYSLKNNSLSYYISLLEFDHRHTECD